MKRRCKGSNEHGEPCGQAPLQGEELCFWHSPEHTQEAAEARRLGGLRKKRERAIFGAYDFKGLTNVAQVQRIIEIAVVDALAIDNSIPRVRALGFLAQVALKALEVGELEARLEQLEAAVKGQKLPPTVFDSELEES